MEDTKFQRIKAADLAKVRKKLLDAQDWICPLCKRDMKMVQPRQRCVDHDHSLAGPTAGAVRGVLCSNCNGNEGRILKRVQCAKGHLTELEWLKNLVAYWEYHQENRTGLVHHTWKSPGERRELKNLKARQYRARLKKGARLD